MHRSRIGVLLIDHSSDTYEGAATFWAVARGGEHAVTGAPPQDAPYESLAPLPGGILLELQRTGVDTPPRVHLDIETDDVPAEVSRLTSLGAMVHEERKGYTIMRDPGGLLFCVVPVQTGADFDAHATTWES